MNTLTRNSKHFIRNLAATGVLLTAAGFATSSFAGNDVEEEAKEAKMTAKEYWAEFKHDADESWKDTKEAFRDGWVESKLESALIVNEHLNPLDIDIEVKGDTAILEGEVESEVHRELAESVALGIEGIDDVDNRLEISKEVSMERDVDNANRSVGRVAKDAAITAEVKMQLLAQEEVGGLGIDVDTRNGQVTLSGEVDSEVESALAESIAKRSDEVTRVVNKLSVKS